MAEGRGFEPPRDLRPYPISSRTPSTGLGHPSASFQSSTYLVSHSSFANGRLDRVEVLPKFANTCGLRDDDGGSRYDLLDGCCQVARGQVRVRLDHAQGPPPAQLLDRPQVYPSRHETGSEGMPQSERATSRRRAGMPRPLCPLPGACPVRLPRLARTHGRLSDGRHVIPALLARRVGLAWLRGLGGRCERRC